MIEIKSVAVVKVIKTIIVRGNGSEENSNRFVCQYWDFKGNLLAEEDPEKNK